MSRISDVILYVQVYPLWYYGAAENKRFCYQGNEVCGSIKGG
jgi:hypothetical protein